MNRRDFLKSLAGIPLLGFLKPEEVETIDKFKQAQLDLIETIKKIEPGGKPFFDIVRIDDPPLMTALAPTITQQLVRWNGAGDSWESKDGGKTWSQVGFAPSYTDEVEVAWLQIRES